MPIIGNKKEKDVIASMFLTAAIVMIFTQMTGVVATIIDGIVTSRFLGSDQYSAVALLGPLVNIVLLFASFVSIGGQIVCSNKVGTGDRDEANAVFTFSLLFGILVAAAFVIFSAISPGTLLQICGVSHKGRPELYEHMLEYLHGYMIGIPAVIMVQILSPFMVMDNGKQLVSLSATVLCLTDIAGDFINALVIKGGVFGMGVATSIAMWLQLLVLLMHFVKKEGYFRLSLKSLKAAHIRDIGQNGLISFVKKLATILRDILTNRINLVVAVSTAAVAAKGMQADLNSLMFCISIGIGRTLLTMSSMYYGAEDLDGLKRAYKYAMLLCIRLLAVVGVILFIAAPLVSRIYTSDPEVTALSVFSIRCMAISLVPDALNEAFQDYLQGIQNRKLVNTLCFAERFFLPVATAWILGMAFGSRGIMASMAVGKIILFLLAFVIVCVRCKGLPRKLEDIMFLPEGFGGKEEDNIYARISTMEDVVRESEHAHEFCIAHGVDGRGANMVALFVEEMGGNIIRHGKARRGGSVCADYRISANGGRIGISLRDYCEEFDPMKFNEIHRDDNRMSNIGIRMVMALAKDIRYINTFNSNCLFMYLENN